MKKRPIHLFQRQSRLSKSLISANPPAAPSNLVPWFLFPPYSSTLPLLKTFRVLRPVLAFLSSFTEMSFSSLGELSIFRKSWDARRGQNDRICFVVGIQSTEISSCPWLTEPQKRPGWTPLASHPIIHLSKMSSPPEKLAGKEAPWVQTACMKKGSVWMARAVKRRA